MARLSDSEREQLAAAAKAEGYDPAAVIAAAEADEEQAPAESGAVPAGLKFGEGLYQYLLPYMRASEVRQFMGLTGDTPDGELFTGEWLAKHGGQPAGGGSSPGSAPEGAPQE